MSEILQNIGTLPLIAIVGQTATGKSDLAIALAERFDGEIICADSRTVYVGMDIGTAKPSKSDRARVPHWGLDLASPQERFTVADFKDYADTKIREIHQRYKVPILVGGSGLYIDAVLYDYQLRAAMDPVVRRQLQDLSILELQARILSLGLTLPENAKNPRYLIRTIETAGASQVSVDRSSMRPHTLVLGLEMDMSELETRIHKRADAMLDAGLVDEVRRLGERYGWDVPAMQAPAYKAFHDYVAGISSLEQATAAFIKNDRSLAKRQRTWFKRNKSIHWLTNSDTLAEAVDIATTFLDT